MARSASSAWLVATMVTSLWASPSRFSLASSRSRFAGMSVIASPMQSEDHAGHSLLIKALSPGLRRSPQSGGFWPSRRWGPVSAALGAAPTTTMRVMLRCHRCERLNHEIPPPMASPPGPPGACAPAPGRPGEMVPCGTISPGRAEALSIPRGQATGGGSAFG